jgi:hypothetical protein
MRRITLPWFQVFAQVVRWDLQVRKKVIGQRLTPTSLNAGVPQQALHKRPGKSLQAERVERRWLEYLR